MPMKNESDARQIKKCTYLFDKFEHASTMAKEISSLGSTDVELTRTEEKFRLTCRANWQFEMLLISFAPEEFGNFRAGSTYSVDERNLIREMFFFWHDPVEIEIATRRKRSELRAVLVTENLLPNFISLDFNYANLNINSDEDFADDVIISEHAINQFESLGVISTKTGDFLAEMLCGTQDYYRYDDETDESQPAPIVNIALTDETISNDLRTMYNVMASIECHFEAATIAKEVGDYVTAAKFGRAGNTSPNNFYLLLETSEGLPCDFLYQREITKAYYRWNLVNGYPKVFSEWMTAAKLRRKDYYTKESIGIPHQVKINSIIHKDPILDALAVTSNSKQLERLALDGNTLAGALLADRHRIQMKNGSHPLDAAEQWIQIHNNDWPTEMEVMGILAANLPFDKIYASKMEHIGYTYRGFSALKSYTCTWSMSEYSY